MGWLRATGENCRHSSISTGIGVHVVILPATSELWGFFCPSFWSTVYIGACGSTFWLSTFCLSDVLCTGVDRYVHALAVMGWQVGMGWLRATEENCRYCSISTGTGVHAVILCMWLASLWGFFCPCSRAEHGVDIYVSEWKAPSGCQQGCVCGPLMCSFLDVCLGCCFWMFAWAFGSTSWLPTVRVNACELSCLERQDVQAALLPASSDAVGFCPAGEVSDLAWVGCGRREGTGTSAVYILQSGYLQRSGCGL